VSNVASTGPLLYRLPEHGIFIAEEACTHRCGAQGKDKRDALYTETLASCFWFGKVVRFTYRSYSLRHERTCSATPL